MEVGVCKVRLRLHHTQSLKGKRMVARSLIDRVRHRFNVAVAEVEDNDKWQLLTIGFSCVSNHGPHANEVVSTIVQYIMDTSGDAEVLDYEIELVSVL